MTSNVETVAPAAGSDWIWTVEQRQAIEDWANALIVTAGAGSGKTAVLTERVFELITKPDPSTGAPVGLERLLVVTFTRKAAGEMRDRIERRLLKALAADPTDRAARAALEALPEACILTLDAFCDRFVRRHFHEAEVSPAARVAEADEEAELVGQTLDRLFEELAARADDDGRAMALLIATTSPSRGGALQTLRERIQTIRGFMQSLETPENWLASVRDRFAGTLHDPGRLQSESAKRFRRSFHQATGELRDLFQVVLAEARLRRADGGTLEQWASAGDWLDRLIARLSGDEPIEAIVKDGIGEVEREPAATLESLGDKKTCGPALAQDESFRKHTLEAFSKRFTAWRGRWFALNPDHWGEISALAADQALALLRLVELADERVEALKRRRGLLTFADLERGTLRALTDPATSGPSALAREYQRRFHSVLVDEYQDISPLQDALIRRLSRSEGRPPETPRNLFVVGDLKQSIYRFRRAEPRRFLKALEAAAPEPSPPDGRRRVSLTANFRSRPGLIDFVNAVFETLMDQTLGGLSYDAEARLVATRTDSPDDDPICVELVPLPTAAQGGTKRKERAAESDEDDTNPGMQSEALSGLEREARWIARRIVELTSAEGGLWLPDEGKGRRRARPGDCAILVRKMAGDAPTWIAELERAGLAVQTPDQPSFLAEPEVVDVLNALRVADQPFDDLTLAGVLRSPMAGLSDDDLLRLRRLRREGPFHEAVWAARPGEPGAACLPPALETKLKAFFTNLAFWRREAERGGPEAAFEAILSSTEYEAHVAGTRQASERLGHLAQLRQLVRRFAAQGLGEDVAASLRGIEALEAGSLQGSVEGLADRADAVHLLTIHKSKGLEFPIVFLPRLGSPLEAGEYRNPDLILEAEGGMALVAGDPSRRLVFVGPELTAAREREHRARREEHIRLLYVGMTRARERLILSGLDPPRSHRPSSGPSNADEDKPTLPLERLAAGSYVELLRPALVRLATSTPPPWLHVHPPPAALPSPAAADVGWYQRALRVSADEAQAAWEAARVELGRLEGSAVSEAPPPVILPIAEPGVLARLPLKLTVTQLTRMRTEGDRDVPGEGDPDEAARFDEEGMAPSGALARLLQGGPAFARPAGGPAVDGRRRGRLTHQLLEHLDLSRALDEADLRLQAEELRRRGLLEAEGIGELDSLPYGAIARFFDRPLGRRLRRRPGSVLRELPFTRWVPASQLPRGMVGPADDLGPEMTTPILLQGTIDCVLDEGERVLVLDYKTDPVSGPEAVTRLTQRYGPQITAYQRALQTVWRVPEPEAYLVFLDSGDEVRIGVTDSSAS